LSRKDAGWGREQSGLDNLDHFTALVLAAIRASAVRTDFLVAVRALGHLRDIQAIVRPAGGSPALRVAAFWIWHDVSTFS
jgi:hypothetical protein